jgi:acetyl-CoA carboxylase biotin carboxyl carrier protein
MEMTEMEQLIDLVKRSAVRELTLRNGESRITLKKSPLESAAEVGGELIPYQVQVDQTNSNVHSPQSVESTGMAGMMDVTDDIEAVTAPLVGIFHHIKPLIGPGANVTAGQVVAVIEAMNLITEVTSPVNGTVLETTIKDGMPSEYGQTLFLVRAEH